MATLSAPKLGDKAGTVTLPEGAFSTEWNEHLVWHVVRNELLARRQGTHSTKTRAMVRGGGAKPWRQKGTGRARQGTRRAPQWSGGGVVFGPSPRTYGGKVNRKERLKALRAALSMQQARGTFGVLGDDVFGDTPSVKSAVEVLASWKLPASKAKSPKLTVVCTADQESVWKSFRNLQGVMVVPVEDLAVADLMWGHSVLITESALEALPGDRKAS